MAVYKGIDISRWNGAVDMNKVKAAGISFVLIQSPRRYRPAPCQCAENARQREGHKRFYVDKFC